MTLDEAIMHAREKAKSLCGECAKEHSQLAEWLTEYKKLKEKQGEYSWHDLRKNPDDLPEVGKAAVTFWKFDNKNLYAIDGGITDDDIKFIINGYSDTEICIAWRYINPYEVTE